MWTRSALILCILTAPVWAKPTCEEMCGQARELFKQNKIEASLDKYREAIRLDPRCTKAHASSGAILAELAKAEKDAKLSKKLAQSAFHELDQAIQLNPKDSDYYYWRGDLRLYLQQYSPALNDLNRSLQLQPEARAFMSRAMCYSELKKDDLAIADFNAAYKLSGDASSLYHRGKCYRRLRQFDKAEADYQLVVKKGDDPEVMTWARQELKELQSEKLLIGKQKSADTSDKAYALLDQARQATLAGHHQQAIKLYDQCLKADPQFAMAAVFQGDAYLNIGNEERAIACYRQGIRLDPKEKQAHRYLGEALEKKWKRTKQRKFLEQAIACYEEALRLDPDYGYAKVNLKNARESLKTAK